MNADGTPPRREYHRAGVPSSFSAINIGDLIANRWFVHGITRSSYMSVVYYCFDMDLAIEMVAKTLPADRIPDHQAHLQFAAECETWILMPPHRNIVKAYFVEQVDAHPFVFVERIIGRRSATAGLDGLIGSTDLSMDRAINMAVQICDGLIAARSSGILVHRDIKPSNILVTRGWTAKVTDFGLATFKLISQTDLRYSKAHNGQTIEFVGTPAYMSPEHFVTPEDIDVRSDIYSLGCTIFEMLAGRTVYQANSWEEWEDAHMTFVPPPLSEVAPNAPPRISRLLAACLAKDKRNRPRDYEEVRNELVC